MLTGLNFKQIDKTNNKTKKDIFNFSAVNYFVAELKPLLEKNIGIGLVVGAGNLIRGKDLLSQGIEDTAADALGMLSTTINSIYLKQVLKKNLIASTVVNSVTIDGLVSKINIEKVNKSIKNGKVVVFAGGTGNPFFTTDTAAVLRALEIKADLLIKATKVGGIYSDDPNKNPQAKFYRNISYKNAICKNIQVMDATAFALAKENNLNIIVADMFAKNTLKKIIGGEEAGTLVSND